LAVSLNDLMTQHPGTRPLAVAQARGAIAVERLESMQRISVLLIDCPTPLRSIQPINSANPMLIVTERPPQGLT
jgi:hypothetical protein